ncbi:MAG: YfhO family protein [Ignavibacteria bacterium]
MATKTKRVIGTSAKTKKISDKKEFELNNIVPEKYQTAVSLVILFLLFLIFFAPMYFGGKTFQSGDIVTSKSLTTYITTHKEGFTLWNPYVFCGIPAYAMSVGFTWFNLIYVGITVIKWGFADIFSVQYVTWTLYLILLAFTSFFLMKYKTRNTLVSLFAAIAASFSTGLIVFLFIGHVTKLTSICMYPLIFLILLKFKKRIKLLDAVLLTMALQLFVQGWHVQIIFYTLFSVMVYFIYYFIHYLIVRDNAAVKQLFKSAGVFIVAAIIALLIQSADLTQTYNYAPYSTRGAKSVVESKAADSKGEPSSGSEYYDYHTQWSFSPGEVMTFIFPSYYGFGSSVYNGTLSNNQDTKINTYFGQMEMVDVAMYMGVIVFFLGLFAIFTSWNDPFVQFLTIISATGLLVSFGKNFSPVFDLMFYYFPYFDKFRVPSMMLVVVQLSFPFLAGLGLNKIILMRHERDKKAEKIVGVSAIAFGTLFILTVVMGGVVKDWFTSRLLNAEKIQPQIEGFKQLAPYISTMFYNDALIAFAIMGAVFGLAYAYINSKINKELLALAVIIFTLFDLWRIDSRGAEYVQETTIGQEFNEPDYVKAIKERKDNDPYRIISLKQDGSPGSIGNNANYHAYFLIQDIYGYSGIKPRAYQDIIDVLGTVVNPTLWRMLNVRYVVFDKAVNFTSLTEIYKSQQSTVYQFDTALPRAYFVNTVQKKPAIQILNLIKNNSFDPKNIAFLEDAEPAVDKPDSNIAYVKMVSYKDEHITIDAKATGNNFLFLGDTYFPKGWKALVDGSETTIYRTNHNFRGIVVPKGQHKVEFIYAPISFTVSKYLALILSAGVIIIFAVSLVMTFKEKKTD